MGIGGQHHSPAPLPRERPGTLCAQVWVGFVVDLDGYQKISTSPAFEPQTINICALYINGNIVSCTCNHCWQGNTHCVLSAFNINKYKYINKYK
jgi:hypothetical protein